MKRERMRKAISHHETDRVPFNIELTGEEMAKVLAYTGIDRAYYDTWSGNHIEKITYNSGGEYIKPGYFKDEFGVVWNRNGLDRDIGLVDEILIKEPGDGIPFPEPDTGRIHDMTENILQKGIDTFKFGKIGLAYFERAWSLRGMENLLMDFLLEPDTTEALFENILDYNMKIMDAALEHDIDGFYFGDDYGQQTGLIMSPESWRKFIRPGLERMFRKARSAGKSVALHSCGNISAIFGDLIDIGLDIYQTFQPEIYDIGRVKRDYGKDLTFWGGISTQRLLPFATPEEIKKKVSEIIRVMSPGGGYIASPTHQVPADVPPENIVALVELLKN